MQPLKANQAKQNGSTTYLPQSNGNHDDGSIESKLDQDNHGDLEEGKGSAAPADHTTADHIVDWAADDPDHPYNWPRWKIVLNFIWVAGLTFMSTVGSAMFAPAVPVIVSEFDNHNSVLETLVVSTYLLGYASGPLLTAPLSELYGRMPVYHASNIGFILFSVACALSPSFNALIVFRFFAGAFGATPMTNGGGSVGDMIRPEKRAKAMSVYLLWPLLGPVMGPICGGFLTAGAGWRWNFWVIAIASGVLEIGMLVGLSETYGPVLLRQKVAEMRKETGNQELVPAGSNKHDKTPRAVFARALIRPLKLLVLSPMISLVSFWMALSYGYMYMVFTSISPEFGEKYHIGTNLIGLTYIGVGVGTMVGVWLYSITADKYMKNKSARLDAAAKAEGRAEERLRPEHRLFLMPLGVACIPIGLFLYGWPTQYGVQWMVPIIGTAFLGCALNLFMMSSMTYLIDAFNIYAASAMAASTVLRSLTAGILPIAALPLYDKLGLGWGNSLLAFIAIALSPSVYLILRHGEYLRKKFEIKDL